MANGSSIFAEVIQNDRANRESKEWRGTLLDYLEKVREDPSLTMLAHTRLYNMIMREGASNLLDSDDPRVKRLYKDESLKAYNFFKDEFFGIERTIAQIVRYFHSASLKGEESRQVLYFMGPVGSGKSSLVEKLQRGLEFAEPIYSIEGCPMFEEPLHLIPRHLRKEFEKMLGMHIEGDLCPTCRFRLKEEFAARYEEVPVVTVSFSKRNRKGIGVVPPVDPNNQDTSGSMDTMKKYLARSFFFLLYQFVSTKYRNVELVFVAHHMEGKEVTEDEFFHRGESGGTLISSGYNKALEIIRDRYHPSVWNIYAFHCSDGDNFESDNAAAFKAAKELCDVCNLFGYGEIKTSSFSAYESSMIELFRQLGADNFKSVTIAGKEYIWPCFCAFLARERPRATAVAA